MTSSARSTPPLRAAVIGIGGIGSTHLRVLDDSDRFDLQIACDSDQFALDYIHVDDPKLGLATDWRKIVDRAGDLDVVFAAVPHDLYAEIVPELLNAGLHVFMEKPFGRNTVEAMVMAEAAELNERALMVGGQFKFGNGFRRARRVVSDRLLGDVFLVRGTSIQQWGQRGEWGWRADAARSGGAAVIDSGWHVIEQIVALTSVPVAVYAAGGSMRGFPDAPYDVDDKAAITLQFEDGSIGHVLTCCVTTPHEWRIGMHGTDGTMELQQRSIRLEFGKHPPGTEKVEESDTMLAQAEHFANVIQRNVPSMAGPEHGLQVMRVVEAAYRSMDSGKAEQVQPAV